MACEEAELGPETFAERMNMQQILQGQVKMLQFQLEMIVIKVLTVEHFTAIGDAELHAKVSSG